jgi:hypothetical protein
MLRFNCVLRVGCRWRDLGRCAIVGFARRQWRVCFRWLRIHRCAVRPKSFKWKCALGFQRAYFLRRNFASKVAGLWPNTTTKSLHLSPQRHGGGGPAAPQAGSAPQRHLCRPKKTVHFPMGANRSVRVDQRPTGGLGQALHQVSHDWDTHPAAPSDLISRSRDPAAQTSTSTTSHPLEKGSSRAH